MSDVTVTPLRAEQLDAAARLHVEAFRGYMTSRLGRRYARAFLQWFAAGGERIALVAVDADGSLLGYVCGAPLGYQREMNRALLPVAATAAMTRPWLAVDRNFRDRVASRLRALLGRGASDPPHALPAPTISLVGIGVSPRARGRNVGAALMQEFEARSRALGMQAMRLSVYSDNTAARRLYEKAGWRALDAAPGAKALYFAKVLG